MWNLLQEYATNPWVGFAFGIIVLILGWKMSATWANQLLVVAWFIFIISAYRTPPLPGQSILPRVLWVALFGAILGLAIYHTLWTKTQEAVLGLMATTSTAEHPPSTTIAGIPWRSPYVEMHLVIRNPTRHAYEDLDLFLRPDRLVAEIGQESSIENVSFEAKYDKSLRMELHRKTGQRFAIPLVLIASDRGYHVRCSRLPAKTSLLIVMATVTMAGTSDEPEKNPFSKSYRIRFGFMDKVSGRQSSIWYGHKDRPDSVRGAKSPPTTLTVDGNYIAAQQTQTVSERIEVHDLFGEAVKQIRNQK